MSTTGICLAPLSAGAMDNSSVDPDLVDFPTIPESPIDANNNKPNGNASYPDGILNGKGKEGKILYVGLCGNSHYKDRMDSFRFACREALRPIIEKETPILAHLQKRCRSPFLDLYFAWSANLGTHTFYLIFLPIPIFSGFSRFATGLILELALGVYLSGCVKDYFCLPRPLSPPLQRISMSNSAALEYGFPSTHTANAVASVLWTYYCLTTQDSVQSPLVQYVTLFLCFVYLMSLVLGRLYCGMHGFADVIIGAFLGVVSLGLTIMCLPIIDASCWNKTSGAVPLSVIILGLILVRIHPEPVDPCPCFEDSVAFVGVMTGILLGGWVYTRSPFAPALNESLQYNYWNTGILSTAARIVVGSLLILIWRAMAKPLLLSILPHIWRVAERIGISLPRKDYIRASQYDKVPDIPDQTMPDIHEFPQLIRRLSRSSANVQVGPQSVSDVYARLHYQRTRSPSGHRRTQSSSSDSDVEDQIQNGIDQAFDDDKAKIDQVQQHGHDHNNNNNKDGGEENDENDDQDIHEMLRRIKPVRVQYDVEVITKFIVYSGIGFAGVCAGPFVFRWLRIEGN